MNSTVLFTDNFCFSKSFLEEGGITIDPKFFQKQVEKYILQQKAKEIYDLYKNPVLLEKRFNELTDVPKLSDGVGKSMLIEFLQKNSYRREVIEDRNLNRKIVKHFSKIFFYYIRNVLFKYSKHHPSTIPYPLTYEKIEF